MSVDYGERVADEAVEDIEQRVRSIYQEAADEIQTQMDDFIQSSKARDTVMRQKITRGEITLQQYQDWQMGQVFIGERWEKIKRSIVSSLLNANQIANNIVEGKRKAVFAECHNWNAFSIDKRFDFGLSFGLYDDATVTRLLKERPELLPRRKIKGEKDKAWNRTKISNSITKSILMGESIPEAARRLSKEVSNDDMKAMIRYARTAMTGAQNAGRIEAMHEAKGMGIWIKKQWLATLDKRTRDAHQHLDGQIKDVDEPFESDLGEIKFPGDPEAEPGNVYNCRCTLINVYPEYESHAQRRDNETGEVIEDMTYDEWKASKEASLGSRSFGFKHMEHYDFDRQVMVATDPQVTEIVNEASRVVAEFEPAIDDYAYRVGYGDTGDGNPAEFDFAMQNGVPGMVIALNPDMWKDIAKIDDALAEGRHVANDKRESIIYHEYGHLLSQVAALRMAGYNGAGAMHPLQIKALDIARQTISSRVVDIEKKYDKPISARASDDSNEAIAEAFSAYFCGTRTPQVIAIVNYIKGVIKNGIL